MKKNAFIEVSSESSPCKYEMSPFVKKKIEDMSTENIKKLNDIYSRLLQKTGPQSVMIKMELLKEPLQNLENQNVNLVSMFMQNLAQNIKNDPEEMSP